MRTTETLGRPDTDGTQGKQRDGDSRRNWSPANLEYMIDPIIITGAPRSGTSLTMKILHAAGMQVGTMAETQTAPGSPWGEGRIRDQLFKPILEDGGFDPLAQDPLPPVGWYPDMEPGEFRRQVLELVEVRDLTRPWGFKAIKGVLFWKLLNDAFPDAKWVMVDRGVDEHIASLMRTPFMTAYNTYSGWRQYLREIEWHIEDAVEGVSWCIDFQPAWVRDGDWEMVGDVLDTLGLKMCNEVKQQFNQNLYRK